MAGNGNEFLPNYVEHIVPLQEKKLILPKKIGIIFAAIFLVFVVLALILTFNAIAGLGAVLLILVAYVIWYLWRFVSIEFEYTVIQGELSFDIVYGRRQRKKYFSTPISKIEKFGKMENGEVPQADLQGVEREVFCAAKKTNPNTRYALLKDQDGKKVLLYFEITEKAEKVLRFHNSRAFMGY